MERNKLMYDAISILGTDSFGTYLREHNNNFSEEELRRLIVYCLPKNDDITLPPMLAKFARYVGKKAPNLFVLKEVNDQSPSLTNNQDLFLPMPPFESYLNISKQERLALFFRSIRKYDIIDARIVKKEESHYYAEVICFANAKHRVIDDLHFNVILDCDKDIEIGALVRAVFLKTCLKERQLFISINNEDLPAEFASGCLKLGIITEDELPSYYKIMKTTKDPCSTYLKGCIPKTHLSCVNMLKYFNSDPLDIPSYTVFASEFTVPREKTASFIQEKQMSDLSTFKYRQGMEYYINGPREDALKCFNESLKLNPKNIDALLSCGALFLNNKKYKSAIAKFEKVLELKDSNERATQFLCSSLEKLIQSCEENEYSEIFKSTVKLMQHKFKLDMTEKHFLTSLFGAEYSDEFGYPWFKSGNFVKVVEDYPSSSSDMEIEDIDDNKIEIQVPEVPVKLPEVSVKQEAMASSSQVGGNEIKSLPKSAQDVPKEQSPEATKCKSAAPTGTANKTKLIGNESSPSTKPEVSVKEETPKTSETDLHKIKCDEFISSNLKKRSLIRQSSERTTRKEKRSRRHHSKHRHHKKKKRRRRLSRSSSSHKDELETDDLSDISSGSDIYDRSKLDLYGPSPPPSTSKSNRFLHHDVSRRSVSPEESHARSRTVRLRGRSRSRSRHSTSRSPIRYPEQYLPCLLPRASTSTVLPYPPIEPVSGASYLQQSKSSALKIMQNLLDSRK